MTMRSAFRTAARRTGLYDLVASVYQPVELQRWKRRGRPLPAPAVAKRDELRRVAEQHGLRELVETGTLRGDTVRFLRGSFDRITSIELSADLHSAAQRRLAKQRNARLIHGDSAVVLPGVIASISRPALFWLDAHYSGPGTARGQDETPVERELLLILADERHRHVVMIDDARLFTSAAPGYPSTQDLALAAKSYGYDLVERMDILHVVPSDSNGGR